MRRGMFKILGIFLLVFSLLVIFCDKKSTDSDDNGSGTPEPSALVGTWLSQTATVDVLLETSSNQTANDFLSEADGEIGVTGAYNADLKYLLDVAIEDVRMTMVTENMILLSLLKPTSSSSMLSLTSFGLFGLASYEVVEDGDTTTYYGDFEDFTLSETQAQLTADNAVFTSGMTSTNPLLKSSANTATVTLDGTITAVTKAIPANTPTSILPFPLPLPADDIGTVTMNENGTFTAEFTMEDFVEVDTTITGIWYVDDGTLYLAPPAGEEGDTLEMDYSVQGSNLTIDAEIAISEFLEGVDTEDMDVMELLEGIFGFDDGSLEDAIIDITIIMSKGTSKMVMDKREKSPWFDDEYRNQMIAKMLHRLDSIIKR